jgi:hypothetical protein
MNLNKCKYMFCTYVYMYMDMIMNVSIYTPMHIDTDTETDRAVIGKRIFKKNLEINIFRPGFYLV